MLQVGPDDYVYDNRFFFRFYRKSDLEILLSTFPATLESLELAVWIDPPHEGYREYPHEHQSWVFALRKGKSAC